MAKKQVAVALAGAGGRMGEALREVIRGDDGLVLVAAVEHDGHPLLGTLLDGVPLRASLAGALEGADVLVDFTIPEATARHAAQAATAGVPFVSGTTGLDEAALAALDEAAERIALLWAPNMSVGVNVLLRLVEEAARALGPDFDIEMTEFHHRRKIDAPSGTALRLAEVVQSVRRTPLRHGRQGLLGVRPPEELGVHALRGGDVVGDHTLYFAGPGERIELTHRAHSRKTFAAGALRAARYLLDKPPGRYEMRDVLAAAP